MIYKKDFMKNLLLFMVFAFSLVGCEDKNEVTSGLEGNYKLTKIYADPGNGSGTYQPVNFDPPKEIEFGKNGSFSSKNFTSQDFSAFNFVSYELKGDGTILFKTANSTGQSLRYVINGNELTISFICIEGCGYRFTKL